MTRPSFSSKAWFASMNILIHLTTDNELIAYEALALAFTMATFDHDVQLFISKPTQLLLIDKQSRIYGMMQSLDLYDMNRAWHDFDDKILMLFDDKIRQTMTDEPNVFDDKRALFDSVIEF